MWRRRRFLHFLPAVVVGQGVVQERRERKPNVVLVAADAELKSEKSLSNFTATLESKHGMRCTLLTMTSPTELEGADALESADHSIWLVRGLRLPSSQLRPFQDYAASDKPLITLADTLEGFVNWPAFRSVAEKKKSKLFSVPGGTPSDFASDAFQSALLKAVYSGLGRESRYG